MIIVEHLSKSYGKKQVLHDVNLELQTGKVYGIVGKNGAGKTTLFNCISGVESYEGVIKTPYTKLKNHLGLLETNPQFLSRITGWEYLKLFCIARNIGTENFEEQNIFDLPLHEYAENYSTGMKKKLAIMAILLQKNEVFILDEPFNGVDINSNLLISGLIEKLRSNNKLIIISSHIFSTLGNLCDKIFLLEDGYIKKKVGKEEYAKLEEEMKAGIIDDRLDRLTF